MKTKIGIILDFQNGSDVGYSKRDHYALRKNYIDMVEKQGAMAILIPYNHAAILDYIEIIDGLLIVGGAFDIDPKRYGETFLHPKTHLNKTRENFEFAFVDEFLKTKKAFLGICNGMQLLNVIKGGSIMQDVLDENAGYINHEQSKVGGGENAYTPYHEVNLVAGSLLHKIVEKTTLKTNSSHHQAVRNVAASLKINALALDGIVEGIEDDSLPFCLGIQWHPEFAISEADEKLFAAFVLASSKSF